MDNSLQASAVLERQILSMSGTDDWSLYWTYCLHKMNTISFTIKKIINTDKGRNKPVWIKHPWDWEWSVGFPYSFPLAKMDLQSLNLTNWLHMINTVLYSSIKKEDHCPLIKKNSPPPWIYKASMGLPGKMNIRIH